MPKNETENMRERDIYIYINIYSQLRLGDAMLVLYLVVTVGHDTRGRHRAVKLHVLHSSPSGVAFDGVVPTPAPSAESTRRPSGNVGRDADEGNETIFRLDGLTFGGFSCSTA